MKKLFMILLSAALFVCCSDDKEETSSTEGQKISLNAETILLDKSGSVSTGSSSTITVTSSAEWRLTGDVSWCTPSVAKGSNGTTITFSASANETGENREVNLYFICGDATQKLNIKQFPEEVVEFKNVSDSYTMAAAGGRMTIRVNTNLDTNNCEVSEEWVRLYRAGDSTSGEQWVQFVIDTNTTFYDREATITMFKGTDLEKEIKVTQTKHVGIVLESPASYEFGVSGGKVTVKATGNISFKTTISGTSTAWLSAVETSSTGTDIITKTFEITCAAGNWTRTGTVALVPNSGTTINLSFSQVDPNPSLFDVPDAAFANRLVTLGYLIAKDSKYYMTYTGYTATSFSSTSSASPFMQSVEGIERLENITSFTLYYTNTRKIDLSKNTKITSLTLYYSPFEEIILGDLNITTLTINNYLYNYYDNTNRAKSFTATSSKLKTITINHTTTATYDEVEFVDITGCPALTSLSCNRNSGNLKEIRVTQAQKDAYTAGTLTITTNAAFNKTTGIVVK